MAALLEFLREKHRTTPLWLKVLIPILGLGTLGVVAVTGAVLAFVITAWLGQPIPVLGFDQSIEQPIPFSHTIHAGTGVYENSLGDQVQGLGMDCTFCHRTVTTQANAGIPPVQFCAYCHQVIGKDQSEPLTQIRMAAGVIGDDPHPINWKRVHRMPDHVRFVHEPHIRYLTANPEAITNSTSGVKTGAAGVCSTCHGDVASMTKTVTQVEPLKMGQCVNCHRDNNAPTDCASCHH
ncbi:MAG: hypothetical protein F4Y63_01385 [Chloroflexi bacterium]|nr:hypothetical protein [Chloroflexota bacterium]MYK60724.1 hypothetical protein [Chloroflexota bacterium]